MTDQQPILVVDDLTITFGGRGRRHSRFTAVDGVSLTLAGGETLGLVGESGSGKSTLGYSVLGRYRATAGRIVFNGCDITSASRAQLRDARRQMQMVFQDPYSSMNPRMKVVDIVGEPLVAYDVCKSRDELRTRVGELVERCGLSETVLDRYPSEFSGGQRQRIAIARALALRPKLVVADEPTSALDVSVQAQIINLLSSLQQDLGISYLFISHNLAVVRHIVDRIAIMKEGRIVEIGDADHIFDRPSHPYTQALLAAVPTANHDWLGDDHPIDLSTDRPGSPNSSWDDDPENQSSLAHTAAPDQKDAESWQASPLNR